MVRAPDLKSGDSGLAGFVRGSPLFNSSAALVHSQLVCLPPVGTLNLLSSSQLLVSLALESPSGEWSITYVCMYINLNIFLPHFKMLATPGLSHRNSFRELIKLEDNYSSEK